VVFHKTRLVGFPRFLRPWFFAWAVQRQIMRGRFDLVHSHERILRADVFSLHCIPHARWVRDVRRKRASLFDRALVRLERRMVQLGADSWFLPVSSLVLELFRREHGVVPGQWQVMHPGVDVARFAALDRDVCRKKIRDKHGIGGGDLLLLFVGMNFEAKGLDKVLRAIVDVPAKLLVVGRGNERKYRALANTLGVGDKVIFAGTLPLGVEDYYYAADAFILLSTFDAFGMVVLEAMAARLPVIVSTGTGAKDLGVDGENGFVWDEARSSSLAAVISRLLDRGARRRLGERAFQTASAHDWQNVVDQTTAVYLRVKRTQKSSSL
ncbi:MAG: glycosyltransferase family 4 protein, partial [Verrucomicrobiae bacterium]|nr:glycosyltransferase family 4 protein [Verrucomicrobiae bacterium]